MEWLEAKLIVPGSPTYDWRVAFEQAISRRVGGFTVVSGRGAGREGKTILQEQVRVYTIAYENTPRGRANIDYLADLIRRDLKQETVYLSETVLTGPPIV